MCTEDRELTRRAKRLIEILAVTLGVMCFSLAAVAAAAEGSKAAQQQEIRAMASKTLSDLYKAQPKAKAAVQKAAGYGVFSNFGMKIFVLGTGRGEGVIVDNATKKETFMKMVQVGGGLGMGAKDFGTVFLFESKKAMNDFIDRGWEFGGEAAGAAKWGERGGAYEQAVSVMPGVWVYQLTEKGLAAEAMVKGTKYYRNDDLN